MAIIIIFGLLGYWVEDIDISSPGRKAGRQPKTGWGERNFGCDHGPLKMLGKSSDGRKCRSLLGLLTEDMQRKNCPTRTARIIKYRMAHYKSNIIKQKQMQTLHTPENRKG